MLYIKCWFNYRDSKCKTLVYTEIGVNRYIILVNNEQASHLIPLSLFEFAAGHNHSFLSPTTYRSVPSQHLPMLLNIGLSSDIDEPIACDALVDQYTINSHITEVPPYQ